MLYRVTESQAYTYLETSQWQSELAAAVISSCLQGATTHYPEVTQAEVVTAIKRLKNNKAPGVCNILPEMLKYGGDSVHAVLYGGDSVLRHTVLIQ